MSGRMFFYILLTWSWKDGLINAEQRLKSGYLAHEQNQFHPEIPDHQRLRRLPRQIMSNDVTAVDDARNMSLPQTQARNSMVTSQTLTANKEIQVFKGTSNPETFRISVTVSPSAPLYQLTLIEDTIGLRVITYVAPSDKNALTVLSNSVQYNVGNATDLANTFSFIYDATLSDSGSQISTLHDISTLVQYFADADPQEPLRSQESLSLSVCIYKNVRSKSTACSWCWSILIIVICFIVGLLLGFFVMVCFICLKRPYMIQPSHQKLNEHTVKKQAKQNQSDYDITNLAQVLAMKTEREMFRGVELLELQRLFNLERRIQEERMSSTKHIMIVLFEEEKQSNIEEADERAKYVGKCLQEIDERQEKYITLHDHKISSHEDSRMLLRHEEEMEDWKNKLNGHSQEFQSEMMPLIERRHEHERFDELFIHNLQMLLLSNTNETSALDDVVKQCLDKLRAERGGEKRAVARMAAENENILLDGLLRIYSENASKILNITKNRNNFIAALSEDIEMQKKVWNKMAMQLLDVLQVAERQELILSEDEQRLKETIQSALLKHMERFEMEWATSREQSQKIYEAAKQKQRHNGESQDNYAYEEELEEELDAKMWIKTRLKAFGKQLKGDIKAEDQLDTVAFQILSSLNSLAKQTRKSIKYEKQQLQEKLIVLGVDESWIGRMFRKHDDELAQFCDDLDSSTSSPAVASNRDLTRPDVVSLRLLQMVESAQPMTSQDASASQPANSIRKQLLKGTTHERVKILLHDQQRIREKKAAAIDDVINGSDEAGIRRELQEKLTIATEVEKAKKKDRLRDKRRHLASLRENLISAISESMCQHLKKSNEEATLIRDRHALEELRMTFLNLMTSSGKLTSRECKMVIEEFRTQSEEIKGKFLMERKRREELFKRKTERSLIKKQEISPHLDQNDESSLLGNVISTTLSLTDEVINASADRVFGERERIQVLLAERQEVHICQEKALFEQELTLIKKLAAAMQTDCEEIHSSLQLLLPGKPSEEISEMTKEICSQTSRQNKRMNPGALLESVEQGLWKRKRLISEQPPPTENTKWAIRQSYPKGKLSPIAAASRPPGIRPDPLERTSTPEQR